MKRLAWLLVVLTALCFCSAAWSKGLSPARVCGESACVQLERGHESTIVLDANAERPAPPPSGYYRLHYAVAGAGPHLFVPHGNRLAAETAGGRALRWYALYGPGPEQLHAAIRRLQPITPPPEWPTSIETPAVPAGGSSADSWLFGVVLALLAAGAILVRRASIPARTA